MAKALKEAGYPQYFEGFEDYGYFMNGNHSQIYNHDENDCPMYYHILCVAPTYMEAWLWLWREKGIYLEIEKLYATESYIQHGCVCGTEQCGGFYTPEVTDPEEAIIAAIEYLVENDLIK